MKRSIGPRQAERAGNEAMHIRLWAIQVGMVFEGRDIEEYDEDVLARLQALENTARNLRERLERTTKRIAPEDPAGEKTTCADCGQEVLFFVGYGRPGTRGVCPKAEGYYQGHRVNGVEFKAWEARMDEYAAYRAKSQKAGA